MEMTPAEFRMWRKNTMKIPSRVKAAKLLGVAPATIRHYETGKRHNGDPTSIPKHIVMACGFLAYVKLKGGDPVALYKSIISRTDFVCGRFTPTPERTEHDARATA